MPKEKIHYKVLFFDDYNPNPIRIEYAWAFTPLHAKNAIRRRGYQLDRETGDFSLIHLFFRDDIHIQVAVVEKKEIPKKEKTPEEVYMATGVCPLCGGDIEADFCDKCGWQRTASWWGRIKTIENFALSKRAVNNRGDR